MKDRRKSPRKKATFKVEINHPELGRVVGYMRDMSEKGIFLEIDPSILFGCGKIVGARIIGDTDVGIDPLLSMEVVRVETTGVALKYVVISEEMTEPDLDAPYAEDVCDLDESI